MTNYLTTDGDLTSVANAIRAKTGSQTNIMFPSEFVSEIGTLTKPTGTINTTPKVTSQTIDVRSYATNVVGPIYEDVSSSATMDTNLVAANEGKMYQYTGTTGGNYTNGRLYVVCDVPVYNITNTLTNCTGQSSNPTTIELE